MSLARIAIGPLIAGELVRAGCCLPGPLSADACDRVISFAPGRKPGDPVEPLVAAEVHAARPRIKTHTKRRKRAQTGAFSLRKLLDPGRTLRELLKGAGGGATCLFSAQHQGG